MKIRIYQLKNDDNLHYYRFESFERMAKHGFKIDINNYVTIYEENEYVSKYADVIGILNEIYSKFQGLKPSNYTGYSVSVSDIIEINDELYYVDSFGFKKLI